MFFKKIMISIVIPTYKEKDNIGKLLQTIDQLKINQLEIIVVDDNSPDNTADEVEKISKKLSTPVKLLRRSGPRDLSLSVLDGFKIAQGEILGVMDADGSHPASIIPLMIDKINKGAEIVVASRNIAGSETKNWPWSRKINAWVSKKLALSLTQATSDPMSGFFFFRKKIIENTKLKPLGYKILLEILVKSHCQKAMEESFIFEDRKVGQSKLNLKIILKFLWHTFKLHLWKIKILK